jgi:hypothetical protein
VSEVAFKVGDRAVVNGSFDVLVPDRDRLIGKPGTVVDAVPDVPECLYFKPDDSSVYGWGKDGCWAVFDYELDKLES